MENAQGDVGDVTDICPDWTRRVAPRGEKLIRLGLEHERRRLHGKPFVVASKTSTIDYDGLTQGFELLEGFETAEAAEAAAKRSADAARREVLDRPVSGGRVWQVSASPWTFTGSWPPDPNAVGLTFQERFEMTNGSGFDTLCFDFVVLHVPFADVVGPELFAFVKAEWEAKAHLMRVAEKTARQSGRP